MNVHQKKLLIIFLVLFFISIIFVPTEISTTASAETVGATKFEGYRFIWNIYYQLSLSTIFVEWFGLLILYLGINKLLKA